jgi:hypothetical protein
VGRIACDLSCQHRSFSAGYSYDRLANDVTGGTPLVTAVLYRSKVVTARIIDSRRDYHGAL